MEPKANVLIVIDMQNDFINGSLGSEQADLIVDNVSQKIIEYMNNNLPIYYTLDTHYNNYLDTFEGRNLPVPHCINGTYGHKLHRKLIDLINYENSHEVIKNTFGTFAWNTKDFITDACIDIDLIDNRYTYTGGSIEICGLCTDICVVSNALILRAMYSDTPIYVDSKCCAGTTIDNHISSLNVMKSCQIEIL